MPKFVKTYNYTQQAGSSIVKFINTTAQDVFEDSTRIFKYKGYKLGNVFAYQVNYSLSRYSKEVFEYWIQCSVDKRQNTQYVIVSQQRNKKKSVIDPQNYKDIADALTVLIDDEINSKKSLEEEDFENE